MFWLLRFGRSGPNRSGDSSSPARWVPLPAVHLFRIYHRALVSTQASKHPLTDTKVRAPRVYLVGYEGEYYLRAGKDKQSRVL